MKEEEKRMRAGPTLPPHTIQEGGVSISKQAEKIEQNEGPEGRVEVPTQSSTKQ